MKEYSPGHCSGCKWVQSGPCALLGSVIPGEPGGTEQWTSNVLPSIPAVGYVGAKFTCGENADLLDISHLWKSQPLVRNQTASERDKASLTSSKGLWTMGLQIQIDFHRKKI